LLLSFGAVTLDRVSAEEPRAFASEANAEPVARAGGEPTLPLRLAVARGALGIELYEPFELGPLELTRLSISLPGLKFPVDLSGGVSRFRHKRGVLERLELRLQLGRLGSWLSPRLPKVLGAWERSADIACIPGGISIGLVAHGAALAFDLIWASEAGDLRVIVARARGSGLGAPALRHALELTRALELAPTEQEGRMLRLSSTASKLTRTFLPGVGVRVPDATGLCFGALERVGDELRVVMDKSSVAAPLSDVGTRELELARLLNAADAALIEGDLDRARSEYLLALERAPRHPEIVRAVAEIDTLFEGRAEAALGLLTETLPIVQTGAIGAELLARSGDVEGARAALAAVAAEERYAPLAAMHWARLSELEPAGARRLAALDRAVGCAPALEQVRWKRFEARVERGEIERALADAQALEAQASGSALRHAACLRGAQTLVDAGWTREAGKLFERALRYRPDDPVSTAGLAKAFLGAGRRDRALALLERAVTLTDKQGLADAEVLLTLARLLADPLGDLPQAVARVRQIGSASPRAAEARALEGTWREDLGDLAGASLSYAKLRESLELTSVPDARGPDWLLRAARFEREQMQDVAAEERHLAVALRLAPHNETIRAAYRDAAARLVKTSRPD
jgi:cellulose synthase operon protein C